MRFPAASDHDHPSIDRPSAASTSQPDMNRPGPIEVRLGICLELARQVAAGRVYSHSRHKGLYVPGLSWVRSEVG
jgi:hypothetical protein